MMSRVVGCALFGIVIFLKSDPLACGAVVPFKNKAVLSSTVTNARAVCSGDVDGDADLDLVAVSTDGLLYWWENTDGALTSPSEHLVSDAFPGVQAICVSDVDGDADLDILAASSTSAEIAWWENLGGLGTNWVEHSVATGFSSARVVRTADIDRDGDLDVLGAAAADGVAWWENLAGAGTNWNEHAVVTAAAFVDAQSVAAADMDGDGDPDLIGAAGSGGQITWWENADGTGTNWVTQPVTATAVGASLVRVADVDRDGAHDIIIAQASPGNQVAWWRNTDGAGTAWSEVVLPGALAGAASMEAADFDGDGDLDVVAAGADADEVAWWEQTGPPILPANWAKHTVDATFDGASSVIVRDLDGDGDLDVAGSAAALNQVAWWENHTVHGSAVYARDRTAGAFSYAYICGIADFDGDAAPDIFAGTSTFGAGPKLVWYHNTDGSAASWDVHTVSEAASGIRPFHGVAADMDRDGDPDIVATYFEANTLAWWENVSGLSSNWPQHTLSTNYYRARFVAVGDLDGDGDPDVCASNTDSAGELRWWRNLDGAGTAWSQSLIDGPLNNPFGVDVVDIDGDGSLDVVCAIKLGGAVKWYRNTVGDGSVWTTNTISSDSQAASVRGADVDLDGDMDIVMGRGASGSNVKWYENRNGDGTLWWNRVVESSFPNTLDAMAMDLDRDGDMDILASKYGGSGGDMAWWENTDGTAMNWVKRDVAGGNYEGISYFGAGDLDADGALDLAFSAGPNSNRVGWIRNEGGQFGVPTTDIALDPMGHGLPQEALRIDFSHRGRGGDPTIGLESLDLLFTSDAGTPLGTAALTGLVAGIYLHADNGDGLFNDASDVLISSVSPPTPTAGVQTITCNPSDPNVQAAAASAKRFFVALVLQSDAFVQAPNTFRIVHLTEATAVARDVAHALPVALEFTANVTSKVVTAGMNADLGLVKTGPVSYGAGDSILYTLTVTNAGPEIAVDVVVTDLLPPEAQPTGMVVTNIGTLAVGGTTSIAVSAAIDSAHLGPVTNAASVTSGSADPDEGNNTDLVVTDIHAEGNVVVAKSVPSETYLGGDLAYSIVVSNLGPSLVRHVVVTDTLPAEVVYDPAGATVAMPGNVGRFNLDEQPAADGTTIHDTSGAGAHGVLHTGEGAADKSIAGKFSGALTFDAVDDYISHGATLPKQAGTIAHWLRSSTQSGIGLAYYEADSDGYDGSFGGTAHIDRLEIITARWYNYWWFGYQDGFGYDGTYLYEYDPAMLDTWTHVAATWDRSGDIVLYVNGSEKQRMDISGFSFSTHVPTVRRLGRPGTASNYFQGEIDDVIVLDYALSPAEILSLYDRATGFGSLSGTDVVSCEVGALQPGQSAMLTLPVTAPSDAVGPVVNSCVAGQEAVFVDTNPADNSDSAVFTVAADYDMDTMGDLWEQDHGLSPTNALDAALNPDGDSSVNWEEHVLDTDPGVSNAAFRIVTFSNGAGPTAYFPTSSNRVYSLEVAEDPGSPPWISVPGQELVPGTGATDSLVDTNSPLPSSSYRIKVSVP